MALPVMAIFLKKVYADPQFGIMEADEFERPSNFNMELDCDKLKRTNSRGDNSRRVRY
jgi:penicillin-binding protein 1A